MFRSIIIIVLCGSITSYIATYLYSENKEMKKRNLVKELVDLNLDNDKIQEICKRNGLDEEIGFIVGAVSTIEDYYYVSLTPETYKVQYWSCVGDVKPINHENEYGFEKMFPKALKALVEEQLEKETGISKERNLKLYETLIQKHCNAIYSKRPNSVGERLQVGKQTFERLSVSKQIYVLLQILQLSQTSNQGADLSDVGGVKKTGVATLNKKISDKTEFILINQSPAGLYESQVDLLTV